MEFLDLDISHYSVQDLEAFFQLTNHPNYTISDIEYKEYELREKYLNKNQLDKRFTSGFVSFLNEAKQRLIGYRAPYPKPPTTIPLNQKLDPYDIPPLAPVLPRTSELRAHTDAKFVYSQNSEFFHGDMNPLNARILTKSINIDTRFRENMYTVQPQSSDFVIKLPMRYNKVVSMELSCLEFPVAFYTISSVYGNNFLYMAVNYTDIATSTPNQTATRIFTVPDGVYTNDDLLNVLNLLISPKDIFGNLLAPNDIYSYIQFSLGPFTQKLTLSPTGAFAANVNTITLDFTRDSSGNADLTDVSIKIGWNLGYTRFKYTGSNQYIGDTLMDVNTFRYVYLAVDDFQKTAHNYFTNVFGDSMMGADVLARVSTKGSANDIAVNGDLRVVTEPRKYFGPVDIQKLRIRMYDAYGRILPMNGANYSFCLTLKMIYDL